MSQIRQDAIEYCQQWFGEDGSLKNILKGYQPRKQQLEMAAQILECINTGSHAVCEAGTGIGKTLAYLLPCLDSGKKVLIATASKTLQKQLLEKDVPLACKVFRGGTQFSMLKGKDNYLSKNRLQEILQDSHLLNPVDRNHLKKINKWAEVTETGDRAECETVPSNASIWRLLCTKPNDPLEENGYHTKARRKAKESDIIIINQHLLCTELILAERNFKTSILEDRKYAIIDEAHQLRDVATQIFSQKVTRNSIQELVKDGFQAILKEEPTNEKELTPLIQAINVANEEITRQLLKYKDTRHSWQSFYEHINIDWLDKIITAIENAFTQLTNKGKEEISATRLNLTETLTVFKTLKSLASSQETEDDNNIVAWLELYKNHNFSINLTPVQVADKIQHHRKNLEINWIYTSATLTVADQFNHFSETLGLDNQTQLQSWSSPFDFNKQVAWYQPKTILNTKDPKHIQSFIESTIPVCTMCHGKTFLLFCSYYALHEAEKILRQTTDFELFVQSTTSNEALLSDFKQSKNGILLGTASFREGVDVRGQQLSFVAIDKIPFNSPDDPINKAREEWYKQRNENIFHKEYVPKAVVALKQSLGRLIRDTQDYGIVMIGDDRLYTKSYGKIFLDSLPPYQQMATIEELQRFWNSNVTEKNQNNTQIKQMYANVL